MYILVLLLAVVALLTGLIIMRVKKWDQYKEQAYSFINSLICYYLVLILLKYGADKIFKNQFYLPEPNILYTPLGGVNKDLLYWSSMGTSHFFSVFLGSLETVAAILLFFKKTRLIGLLISLMVMLNVVAINFGFDISVKLYSLFLLFLTVYLLAPYFKRLYNFFILHKKEHDNSFTENPGPVKNIFLSGFIKWFIAGIICLEIFYPFIRSNNFNGDTSIRPYLHGAYEVKQAFLVNDTLVPINSPFKKIFIHRQGYIVFQNQDDGMKDYKLQYDTAGKTLLLTDYQMHQIRLSFSYQSADSILTLKYADGGKEYQLISKALNWRKLPALQKGFHWTVDGQ
jgi:hypothetical protein